MQALCQKKSDAVSGAASFTRPSQRHKRSAPRRSCTNAAPDVLTLGLPISLTLPSLVDVPSTLTFSKDTEALVYLADYLVAQDIAGPMLWEQSNKNIIEFVRLGLDSLLGSCGAAACKDQLLSSVSVSNTPTLLYETKTPNHLSISIEIASSGFFELGPMLGALEDEQEGLGCAFYRIFSKSIRSFCWAYDFQNADYARENQVQMACEEKGIEEDELTDEMKEQIELYRPEKSIPARLFDAVKYPGTIKVGVALRLLKAHSKGNHAAWISSVLNLNTLAALYKSSRGDELEECPLPSFVVCFDRNDDIVAAFDEYGQTALEGDQPTVYRKDFDASKPEEVEGAIRSLGLIAKLYAETCKLASEIEQYNTLTNP